jgi:uncharacterized protein (TIGR00299 family) protein
MKVKAKKRKLLYFDCFSGISGDMLLGALLDLGVPCSVVENQLKKLKVKAFKIKTAKVKRDGITATKLQVRISESHVKRNFSDIRKIIEKSGLDDGIKKKSIEIFKKLFAAEAKVHGKKAHQIHLHEMGAIDAIVDIVGASVALKEIGADEIYSSPINVGKGFVKCEHGTFPVPAPATAELLKSIPVYSYGEKAELATPTGAAIISAWATQFNELPEMQIEQTGYGAGSKILKSHPNLLRVFLGTSSEEFASSTTIIETTLDDMNPQNYGYLMDTLFREGALEVFYTNVQMKKNRPGILVTVICKEEKAGSIIEHLFKETTTIGIRCRTDRRYELQREIKKIKTKYGTIRLKLSFLNGKVTQVSAEYDDCLRAAKRYRVPLKEVQFESLKTFKNLKKE